MEKTILKSIKLAGKANPIIIGQYNFILNKLGLTEFNHEDLYEFKIIEKSSTESYSIFVEKETNIIELIKDIENFTGMQREISLMNNGIIHPMTLLSLILQNEDCDFVSSNFLMGSAMILLQQISDSYENEISLENEIIDIRKNIIKDVNTIEKIENDLQIKINTNGNFSYGVESGELVLTQSINECVFIGEVTDSNPKKYTFIKNGIPFLMNLETFKELMKVY